MTSTRCLLELYLLRENFLWLSFFRWPLPNLSLYLTWFFQDVIICVCIIIDCIQVCIIRFYDDDVMLYILYAPCVIIYRLPLSLKCEPHKDWDCSPAPRKYQACNSCSISIYWMNKRTLFSSQWNIHLRRAFHTAHQILNDIQILAYLISISWHLGIQWHWWGRLKTVQRESQWPCL